MPTYEYVCESCGYTFDMFQNMSAEPLKQCPQCGMNVRRIIGGGMGVIVKGTQHHTADKNYSPPGRTCCGRTERCETPPCSDDGTCKR